MSLRCFAAFCVSLGLLLAGPVSAQAPGAPSWTPESLAAAIERQATAASFADLELFAQRALSQDVPDRLERLEHVAWLLLNQSDFAAFSRWNAILRDQALKAGDRRYLDVARIDVLRSRYDQGDLTAETQVA